METGGLIAETEETGVADGTEGAEAETAEVETADGTEGVEAGTEAAGDEAAKTGQDGK